ncbi:MAG: beta-lactamase family protein [Xanthomonadales bacterium]|nr:beta-lactamase family protein [Xanthomonadales bacterium]
MRLPTILTAITGAILSCGLGLPAALHAAAPDRPSVLAVDGERLRLEQISQDVTDLANTLARVQDVAGLAVVLVKDDRILLSHGAGATAIGSGDPVDADTVFRLASLSKAFAATVAGQLVREGALDWQMLVQPWLPGFRLANDDDATRATLRDLLSHRVGLPFNTLDRRLEANEPYPLLVEALPQVPMTCPVGDCFGYQNIAFSLVGDLIFATTGDFYSYQVEKRLFDPLGMHSATYGRPALEDGDNWARPHVRRNGQLQPVTPKDTYYRVAPAAGINASITDLGQWLIANMGGRPEVLPSALLEELFQPVVDTPYEIRGNGWRRHRLDSAGYGLGWRIMDYAGERLVFHAGAVQGYRAMLGFLPEHRFGIAVLWNSEAVAPSGLMATTLDRYLELPARDWLNLDRLRYRPQPLPRQASGN